MTTNPPKTRSTGARATSTVPTLRYYVRQSEDDQDSTEDQLRECERFAAAHPFGAWPGVNYGEVGGREDRERPEWSRLMGEARSGDVVVVRRRNRIGAGPDYVTSVRDLIERGVRLYTADAGEVLWTDESSILESVHGYAAESYVRTLRKDTTSALRERVHAGYAAGAAPFGYHLVPDPSTKRVVDGVERYRKWLRIDEAQAEIVRRIFSLYVSGAGPVAIANTLNKDGIPSPTRGGKSSRGRWTREALWAILRNPIYRGRVVHGRTGKKKIGGRRVHVKRDPSNVITVVREDLAILDAKAAALVDEAIAERFSPHGTGNSSAAHHALTGIVRCTCGGPVSVTNSNGVPYYGCARHRRDAGACDVTRWQPANEMEGATSAWLKEKLLAPDAEERAMQQVRERVRERMATRPVVDVNALVRKLADAKVRKTRAVKLAVETDGDADVTAEIRGIANEVRTLEAAVAAAQEPAVEAATVEALEAEVRAYLAELRTALTYSARQAFMRAFGKGGLNATVEDGNFVLRGEAHLTPRTVNGPTALRHPLLGTIALA